MLWSKGGNTVELRCVPSGYVVFVNSCPVFMGSYPDANRAYNKRIASFEAIPLFAKAQERLERFWAEVVPVRLPGGEIVYC